MIPRPSSRAFPEGTPQRQGMAQSAALLDPGRNGHAAQGPDGKHGETFGPCALPWLYGAGINRQAVRGLKKTGLQLPGAFCS